MKTTLTQHKNTLFYDAIRFYLALVFIVYAKNKLLQDQFTFDSKLLLMPVKDVGLLNLQWYIYSFEPFNYFIGTSQIVTAFFLLFRKTAFYGAILFLVIITNILIIDLVVMEGWIKLKMVGKVVFLLGLDLYLLFCFKEEIKRILNLIQSIKYNRKFSIRYLFYVFGIAILLNCLSIFPKYIYILFTEPNQLKSIFIYDLKESFYVFKAILERYTNR